MPMTCSPRSSNVRANAAPMKPAAPVTTIAVSLDGMISPPFRRVRALPEMNAGDQAGDEGDPEPNLELLRMPQPSHRHERPIVVIEADEARIDQQDYRRP